MKKTILHLFLFLITAAVMGQNSLEVQYDAITNISHLYKTTGVLKISNNKSHYIVLKSKNGLKTKTEKWINGNLNITLPESVKRPQVYTDINKNLLLSGRNKMKMLKEQLPKINWKITDEFKDIGEYKCQKATGYFRGRTYNCWFTQQIPIPFGPWKLQGLPGLIIEVKDAKKEIYFRVTKVNFKDTITINNFPDEEKAIPLKKYIEVILPNRMKELTSKMNAQNSDRNTTVITSSTDRNSQKEIIYEWEEKQK
ncbi:GLPGLI family protein [Tenacibaculum soleae]|uniref:GLPGLI family protein n=1 Tax=Tenacibaculum soleae TaxID=447689 RepID=UPI0026E1CD6F|nr:GLPGLI family protein [Tenacibaculum soleae]MDO6744242.1 GLPGLI family protein [Tenacibaculum soleae]